MIPLVAASERGGAQTPRVEEPAGVARWGVVRPTEARCRGPHGANGEGRQTAWNGRPQRVRAPSPKAPPRDVGQGREYRGR